MISQVPTLLQKAYILKETNICRMGKQNDTKNTERVINT